MTEAVLHRTGLLLGKDNLNKLQRKRVIIFGVGGVGSWCAESLVRSGIKKLTIVDSDRVCITNVNRQLQAMTGNVGEVKVEELKKRLLGINPAAEINALQKIYSEQNHEDFELDSYDYVIDAIDSLRNKIHLIETTLKSSAKLFSSMGAALKVDPTKIKVDSIWKTSGCPLAREIRKALRKKRNNQKFQCVYSEEVLANQKGEPFCGSGNCVCPKSEQASGDPELVSHEWCSKKAVINGSIAHITAIFGFTLAGLVIQSVIEGSVETKSA
jgi:tRNA A37 threonylcarbamoyladenosine dehydratase